VLTQFSTAQGFCPGGGSVTRFAQFAPRFRLAVGVLWAFPAFGAPAEPLHPSFVDSWLFGETIAYGQQTVALGSARPDEVRIEPAYRGDPRYGRIRFGHDPGVCVAVVVDFADEPGEAGFDVYVDGNGDGCIEPGEKAVRDPSAPTPLATASAAAVAGISVAIPSEGGTVPFQRTVAVQVDAFGVVAIVMPRGYYRVALGDLGPPAEAVLVDRDGDGVLTPDGNDGVLPLTPGSDGRPVPGDLVRLRRVTNLGGRVVELAFDPLGTTLTVRPRPDATTLVRPRVSMAEPAVLDHVAVLVIGEDGSTTRIGQIDEPIVLQVGGYRVASCSLSMTDSVGTTWSYTLIEGQGGTNMHPLAQEPAQEWDLTGAWSMDIETAVTTARAGQVVSASLKVRSDAGLELSSCTSGVDAYGPPVPAEVRLVNAAGTEVARAAGGFGCATCGGHVLQVPDDAPAGQYRIVATFRLGPLCGDLTSERVLTVEPK